MIGLNVPGALLCLICAGILVVVVWYFGRSLHHILFGKQIFSVSKPWNFRALPEPLRDADAQLRTQGFQPFGLFESVYPVDKTTNYTWMYTNEEGSIYIEMIHLESIPILLQYTTLFIDDAIVLTRFPMGETLNTSIHHSRFAAKDMEAAYLYHLQKVEEWQLEHGDVHRVYNKETLAHYNDVFYKVHRSRDLGRMGLELAGLMLASVIAIVLLLVDAALMAYSPVHANDIVLTNALFWVAVGLGVGGVSLPVWAHNIAMRPANALDNRKAKPKRELAE